MGMLLDLFRNKWPYTDFHELNADWIISTVRGLIETMDSFIQNESISFADPITWNISSQYAKATVVIDNVGNAYLSKQAVPAGIQLNNSEYWQEIFDFTTYTRTANRNLTFNVETDTTRATATYSVDDWLILNDVLYRVTQPIAIDDAFIIAPASGSNIIHFTVEDFIKAWITTATALINQYKNDINASEADYIAEVREEIDRIIAGATVDSEVIEAREGWNGEIYNTLGNAIRGQISDIHNEFREIAEKTKNLFTFNSPYRALNGKVSYDYGQVTLEATTSGTHCNLIYKLDDISNYNEGDNLYLHFKTNSVMSNSRVSVGLYDTSGATPTDETRIWGSVNLNANSTYDRTFTLTAAQIATGKTLCLRLALQEGGAFVIGDKVTFSEVSLSTDTFSYEPSIVPVDIVARAAGIKAIKSAQRIDNLSAYNDADNLPSNSIFTISTDGFANLPYTNARGTIITANYDATAITTGNVQIFINPQGDTYTRIKWGSPATWSNWNSLTNRTSVRCGERINDLSGIADANDVLQNRIYCISTNGFANLPYEDARGSLVSMNYAPDEIITGTFQLFISDTDKVYTRIKWGPSGGTWRGWIELADGYLYSSESVFSGIECFEKFGVIGDSFASGVIFKNGVSHLNYALSWPQILARMSGNEAINYSVGGYNTYDFVDNTNSNYDTYGLGKVLSDISTNNAPTFYFLCMGINDSNNTRSYGGVSGGLDYLGTSADVNISDPSLNANSFWGNYGRIISAIKANNPDAKLVMCTVSRVPTTQTEEAYDAYNDAIQNIAAFFDIPCLTLTDDPYFTSKYYLTKMVNHHPVAGQYVGYAKGVNRLLSRSMVTNESYYRDYLG